MGQGYIYPEICMPLNKASSDDFLFKKPVSSP